MKSSLPLCILALLALSGAAARAEGNLEPPVPVRTFAPVYPLALKTEGISGLVSVNCLIDEKGNVQEAKVEKATNDAFSQPAIDAIQKWKFKPAKRDGNVISIRVNIPIRFNIDDS